ncbi:metallophosphoesterase family protein [Paenibacillus thermotolerans]|uniref:metallophosphoesterase family protein n=1 Tax=Paenibacillus thermotolerans TaxID=3027807 RepID=UPI00236775D3|nr:MULTISPECIES: metallophosphoesterase [unclassified Paenibacillus]
MTPNMRFVVMGDLHYVQEQSHQEALNGRPKGVTELADVTRNLWFTKHVTPKIISGIAALKPDFVVQTGDIIQGHCDDEAGGLREMQEAMELLEELRCPVFFALGTHDGIPGGPEGLQVERFVYPAIGKALGTAPVSKGYYTFEKAGCLFIVLDYTTFVRNGDQEAFIKETFSSSGRYEHVFVFAHPPLFCVGRPFFTHFDFAGTVLKQISEHPVDAYFCGHTHNQVTTLHKVGEYWLPQLKSTVLAYPDRAPVHLSEVRSLLPEPSTFEYGWGYLEDSAPGWWEITVNGESVQADWHVLNQGVLGQLTWKRGEKAVFTRRPEFAESAGQRLPNLNEMVSVRLRAAGSNCRTPEGYKVSLNGREIGTLPRLEYFDSRQFMAIGKEHWPLLTNRNRLSITTAEESMCIGGFVLEVETAAGWIRSNVTDYFANTDRWDVWGKSPLEKIAPNQSVSVELTFG